LLQGFETIRIHSRQLRTGGHLAGGGGGNQLAHQQEIAAQVAVTLTPASQMADITARLTKLAELHKSGVLTDEEFAAAKKKLL